MRKFLKALVAVVAVVPVVSFAAILNTPHDLGTKTNATTEVCIFCHTPHGGPVNEAGLWNRNNRVTTFRWSSAETAAGTVLPTTLGSGSMKCLSCHDGVTGFGDVTRGTAVLKAVTTVIPAGSPARIAGANGELGGNHPVGVPYPSAGTGTYNGVANNASLASGFVQGLAAVDGVKLYFNDGAATGQKGIECGSCHDPHGVDNAGANIEKFLRKLNDGSALCTTCHIK
jgi:predicted CXXCH cytochrome family protein